MKTGSCRTVQENFNCCRKMFIHHLPSFKLETLGSEETDSGWILVSFCFVFVHVYFCYTLYLYSCTCSLKFQIVCKMLETTLDWSTQARGAHLCWSGPLSYHWRSRIAMVKTNFFLFRTIANFNNIDIRWNIISHGFFFLYFFSRKFSFNFLRYRMQFWIRILVLLGEFYCLTWLLHLYLKHTTKKRLSMEILLPQMIGQFSSNFQNSRHSQ